MKIHEELSVFAYPSDVRRSRRASGLASPDVSGSVRDAGFGPLLVAGVWTMTCPDCGSTSAASGTRLYLCAACPEPVWSRFRFPPERLTVEQLVSRLPEELQNWEGETVAQLVENFA